MRGELAGGARGVFLAGRPAAGADTSSSFENLFKDGQRRRAESRTADGSRSFTAGEEGGGGWRGGRSRIVLGQPIRSELLRWPTCCLIYRSGSITLKASEHNDMER